MPSFFEDVIVRLAEANVEFVVVGGVSATLQGAPVVTFDLDICFRRNPQNIDRLVAALAPLNPRLRDFPKNLPFTLDSRALSLGTNFTLCVDGGDLDLLTEMIAIGGYEQALPTAVPVDIAGHAIKCLSLPLLIQTKTAANRPKDRAVLPVLQATLEMKRHGDEGKQ